MKHGLPPDDWDDQLQKLGGSFLQSREWMLFQQQQQREILWDAGEGWQWAAAIRQSRGLHYVLCAYGPAAQNEPSMNNALTSLAQSAKQLGTDFVRIEPQAHIGPAELRKRGVRQIGEVDPAHSQILDLTHSEDELRAGLASGHRNLINGTKRRGIVVRVSDRPADFEAMLAMLEDTAKRSRVVFHPAGYFHSLWNTLQPLEVVKLYLAEADGQPVASALFYDWGGTRYYAHAGAHQEQNRRLKASVSLVWQAIMDAKTAGFKQFDLGGVAPPGDNAHRLSSLSRFKTAFGGYTVEYAGTWDIPLKPAKYAAYSLYRKLRGRS